MTQILSLTETRSLEAEQDRCPTWLATPCVASSSSSWMLQSINIETQLILILGQVPHFAKIMHYTVKMHKMISTW